MGFVLDINDLLPHMIDLIVNTFLQLKYQPNMTLNNLLQHNLNDCRSFNFPHSFLDQIDLMKKFLKQDQKAQFLKEFTNTFNNIKIKNFCITKDAVKYSENTSNRRIYLPHITDKR